MSGPGVRPRRTLSVLAYAIGALALIVAVICPVILHQRQNAWNDSALRSQCHNLAALPSAALFGGLQIAFALIAATAFLIAWRGTRGEDVARWLIPLTAGLVVLAALIALYGALIVVDAPTSPYQGVDGSGLPCGSG